MFVLLALVGSLIIAPHQPATKLPNLNRVSAQQILLDTGGGGGEAIPPLNLNCSFTAGGALSCFLRWGF